MLLQQKIATGPAKCALSPLVSASWVDRLTASMVTDQGRKKKLQIQKKKKKNKNPTLAGTAPACHTTRSRYPCSSQGVASSGD